MTFGAFRQLGRDFECGITFHHLFERPHPDHTPEKDHSDLLSFVAAHAADIQFNYQLCAEMFNRRIAAGFHPIPAPSPIEFLELLEFRLAEQERVLGGGDYRWQWPASWPESPSWNSHVMDSPRGDGQPPWQDQIEATRQGILVQKLVIGHGRELSIDHWALDLLTGMQRRFLDLSEFRVGFRPLLPLVISSLDIPAHVRFVPNNDHRPTWDIDGILGEYHGGDAITLHVRAIERCADQLGLPHRDVFLIVLIHEVAHYLVHSIPDASSDSQREPWPRDAYDKTASLVHEGLAQLLTHLTIGRFNDHHSRTFESLTENQSTTYRAFRDALAITDDERKLLTSIVQLRKIPDGAKMADWLDILRR